MTMPNDNAISVLTVVFANELSQREIPYFRGAVLSKVPRELDVFHNHSGDTLKYRYPLIQYKRINNHAAIVCIGEGTQAIGNFFAACDFHLQIGNRSETLVVDNMKADRAIIQTWENSFVYTIRKWLPLNQTNFEAYQTLNGLVDQVEFLQRILVGNILSMCSSMNIRIDKQIRCDILKIMGVTNIKYKNVFMQSMDVEFATNVYMPDFIGLGKGVSQGFGMIKQLRKQ